MVMWKRLYNLFSPQLWLDWWWTSKNGHVGPSYFIGNDSCAKCNRFLSWHSEQSGYCSYHNVTWNKSAEKTTPYQLFKGSFEMWLRSRCGGDMDEAQISTDLLTLSSYLDYASTHSQTNGNLYDFCDKVFCDYQMVYDFLIDMRNQAKDSHSGQHEKHPPATELRICNGLHHFIEFRKFQLPIKGIIENRYSATERLLESYKSMLVLEHCSKILSMSAITPSDINTTVEHFLPQYQIIINFFTECDQVRSIEDGCDLDFSTSFLTAYLYQMMPEYIKHVHMVRVRDILPDNNQSVEYSSSKLLDTELSRYVSSVDLPSPVIASACISKLQKIVAIDNKAKEIILSYITLIRGRLTKSNDYLLLDSSGLGLTAADVEERIVTLVYRVTGKVTRLVDRFDEVPTSSTPLTSTPNRARIVKRSSRNQDKKVRFSKVITKKYFKRLGLVAKKLKARKNLILDLSEISSS